MNGGGGAWAPPICSASDPGTIRRSLATPVSGSKHEAIGGFGEHPPVPEPGEHGRRSGFSTPLALDTEEPGGSMIAALVLVALAGLALIALSPLVTAARPRRGHPTDD